MPGSYPHTRATGFTTYSTCRCGHTLSTPQASIHPPYYPAPTTWGADCPAAMREHIAALEAEVAGLRAVADTVTVVRTPRKPVPLAVGQVRLDPDPRRTGDARKVTITGLDAPNFYSGCRNPSAWVSRRGRPSRISVAKLERWAIVPADTVTGGGSR